MMTETQLKAQLAHLAYPCYFVAHGAARDYRTKFRSEHHGVFRSGMVNGPDEAWRLIRDANYPGYYSEMDLIAIAVVDGELTETVI